MGCAKSNLPGPPPPPVLRMDITVVFRSTVQPTNHYYFVALMVPRAQVGTSGASPSGATTVTVPSVDGLFKEMAVTVSDPTISDLSTEIIEIDPVGMVITLADPLPQGAPTGALLRMGVAQGTGPLPVVSGIDRGRYWTEYLLYTGDPVLLSAPDFLHGVGGVEVGLDAGGSVAEVNRILAMPLQSSIEDWWDDETTVLSMNPLGEGVELPVNNAIRFTLLLDEFLLGADELSLQFLVSRDGGVDQFSNDPDLETGFVLDTIESVAFIHLSGFVEGFEADEIKSGVSELAGDAGGVAAADLVWWEVSVR